MRRHFLYGLLLIMFVQASHIAPKCVAADAKLADSGTADLLWSCLKMESEGRTPSATECYRKVLAKDPMNYKALIRLAQITMHETEEAELVPDHLTCEEYLMRASVSQPHRPESYLLLAELNYRAGYMEKGDRYALSAQARDPAGREVLSLLGNRYETACDYDNAVLVYLEAVDNYPNDLYFNNRLYWSASQARSRNWIRRKVPAEVLRQLENQVTTLLLSNPWLVRYYDPNLARRVVLEIVYTQEMKKLRAAAQARADVHKGYRLPDFAFGFCGRPDKPINPYSADSYEAFLKASITDPDKYHSLRAKLDGIRDAARREIGKHQGHERKAKALYLWLKENVLKKYDLSEGIFAEGVLEKQKYLCLTGSILYTLLGRENGLNLYGVIVPGHAYAMLRTDRRDISVELTAEGATGSAATAKEGTPCHMSDVEDGFDVDWWKLFQCLNRVGSHGGLRYYTNYTHMGEIEPEELTAYQFSNVMAHKMKQIEASPDYQSLAGALEDAKKEYKSEMKDFLSQLEEIEKNNRLTMEVKLAKRTDLIKKKIGPITKLKEKAEDLHDRMEKQLGDFLASQGLSLIGQARAMAPLNEDFIQRAQSIYGIKTRSDAAPVVKELIRIEKERTELELKQAVYQRYRARLQHPAPAGRGSPMQAAVQQQSTTRVALSRQASAAEQGRQQTTREAERGYENRLRGHVQDAVQRLDQELAKIDKELPRIEEAGQSAWKKSRGVLLNAIRFVEKGLDEFPCSQELRRTLEGLCYSSFLFAKRYKDHDAGAKVIETIRRHAPKSGVAEKMSTMTGD